MGLLFGGGSSNQPNIRRFANLNIVAKKRRLRFIDLFAGCGGLSLGLTFAGWRGVFAVEKSEDAFRTFERNFLNGPDSVKFDWPSWVPIQATAIGDLLSEHAAKLAKLNGQVDVIAGGPPCQGFSFAGRRRHADPRNMLFEKYVEFVKKIKPKALILENVPGMAVLHGSTKANTAHGARKTGISYYEMLIAALDVAGYAAEGRLLDAAKFGVPQRRPRLVVIGLRKDYARALPQGVKSVFEAIETCRISQIAELGLSEHVTALEAISDLSIGGMPLVPNVEDGTPTGFFKASYREPTTTYQKLMQVGLGARELDSMRLARHSDPVAARFSRILREFPKGVSISDAGRRSLGLLKHRTVPISPDKPAPTLTTLPDDLIHYSEPRILTVRESARLQSFPDWFEFCGKYTTGGARRRTESPRYTQVGNAVPPLLARAIGSAVAEAISRTESEGSSGEDLELRTHLESCTEMA